mmetsp:Transcript_13552/g.38993  ORF Transcript_13552/g.38993 Transcript_13552/m.38993 type:complete len:201 (-) Transcript_13552:342-944(-)
MRRRPSLGDVLAKRARRARLQPCTAAQVCHGRAAQRAGDLRLDPAADAGLVEGVRARQPERGPRLSGTRWGATPGLGGRVPAEELQADGALAGGRSRGVVAHHHLRLRREEAGGTLSPEEAHEVLPRPVLEKHLELHANEGGRDAQQAGGSGHRVVVWLRPLVTLRNARLADTNLQVDREDAVCEHSVGSRRDEAARQGH